MKIKVVYSILEGQKQSQYFKIPDDLIEKLRSWNNPKKAEGFLSDTIKETICEKKELAKCEVEICEFYEKKPKSKSKHKSQQQGFER